MRLICMPEIYEEYIKIHSDHTKQAVLEIDLSDYIKAYQENPTEYRRIRSIIQFATTNMLGGLICEDMLAHALETLPPEESEEVVNSPAVDIIRTHFAELMKNVVDEALLGHNQAGRPTNISLTLEIDNSTHPDAISVRVTDTGRGFPQSFLNRVNSDEGRANYLTEKSDSHASKRQKQTLLFGGEGRGLRMFIADLAGNQLHASGKQKQRFTKPDIAALSFGNYIDAEHPHTIKGAEIVITTSKTPRQVIRYDVPRFDDERAATPEVAEASARATKTLREEVGTLKGEEPPKKRSPLSIITNFDDNKHEDESDAEPPKGTPSL